MPATRRVLSNHDVSTFGRERLRDRQRERLVEVVDPETGERVPEAHRGELVLTGLQKEALPIRRYRTGDVVEQTTEPCECGRTHLRIDIVGRSDGLLVVRGVNVYPTEIESVLLEFDALAPQYRIDVRRDWHLDTIEITAEQDPDHGVERDRAGTPLRPASRPASRTSSLTFSASRPTTSTWSQGALERTEVGKEKRFYDHRDI